MSASPVVSVVIPTFNRADFLCEAVRTALAQTFAEHEVLVVDDGSTDSTRAAIATLADTRLRYIALPHSGAPAKVRNAGVSRARGRHIAFLDSDDLWERTKLADQLAALAGAPACRWCHTGVHGVDEAGAPHPRWWNTREPAEGWILEDLLARRVGVTCSSVLVDRELLAEVGGFDETFVSGEDYDLWVRLALASPIARVIEPRVRRRLHAGQFVGPGWERPVARTLGKMVRSAPTWRLRAQSAKELLRVGALYLRRRARGVLRRPSSS